MERYRPRIARYIRSMIRDGTEAEDLTQDTFLRAHRERQTLRDEAALERWLYQIATRVTIDRLRQRARLSGRQVREPIEELSIVDTRRPSSLVIAEQDEMGACVRAHVEHLSDGQRAVVLLDAEGLTADEIAALLQLPRTTVKMRLHRARQKLQAELDRACTFERDDRGVLVCEPKPRPR